MSSGFRDLPSASPASWDCDYGSFLFSLAVCLLILKEIPRERQGFAGKNSPFKHTFLISTGLNSFLGLLTYLYWHNAGFTVLNYRVERHRFACLGSPPVEKIDAENNTVIDNHCYPFGTKENSMRTPSRTSEWYANLSQHCLHGFSACRELVLGSMVCRSKNEIVAVN